MSHRRYRAAALNLTVLMFMDDDRRLMVCEGEQHLLTLRPTDRQINCQAYRLNAVFVGEDTIAEITGSHGGEELRLAIRQDPTQDELVGFRSLPFSNIE